MTQEYRVAVLKVYQKKKDNHSISLNLIDSQPHTLKAECEAAFEWFEKPDEATLALFLKKSKENKGAYLQAIKNLNANKFKALNNFLHDKVKDPVSKNIEMLAFLIDFKPRPYREGWKPIGQIEDEVIVVVEPEVIEEVLTDQETAEEEPVDITMPPTPVIVIENDDNEKKDGDDGKKRRDIKEGGTTGEAGHKFLRKINIIILTVLATLSIGAYEVIKGSGGDGKIKEHRGLVNQVDGVNRTGGCMYWNQDHYESIACDQQQDNALIILLDSDKLVHLKQIRDTSKISDASIGHVWYFKTPSREIQCFTDSGTYPVDTNRRLLPITKYIIHKYFHR
jgi:hypothetical protein